MDENVTAKIISGLLLQINAIKLSPSSPFTWASGIKSPIYCDNRKTLSFPNVRNFIRDAFVEVIKKNYPSARLIAGVATGAIAHGILVAQALNLPFVYVRSSPKGHGLENTIEGELLPGLPVVVIEDLISTGGSSLKAVEAICNAGSEVLGMSAIFTYELKTASENFSKANVRLHTLAGYSVLLETAIEQGYISQNDLLTLKQWKNNPDTWAK